MQQVATEIVPDAPRPTSGADPGRRLPGPIVVLLAGLAGLAWGVVARLWMRFLHTGEALGAGGQLMAGIASLGAAMLVWTGLALALRRLARGVRARGTQASRIQPAST